MSNNRQPPKRRDKPWTQRLRADGHSDFYLEDHYFAAMFPAIMRSHGPLLSEVAVIDMTWELVDQALLTREAQIKAYYLPTTSDE